MGGRGGREASSPIPRDTVDTSRPAQDGPIAAAEAPGAPRSKNHEIHLKTIDLLGSLKNKTIFSVDIMIF